MSSRSKEKVAAAFRKIFQGNRKTSDGPEASDTTPSESPARRLLRHTVQPVDTAPTPAAELRAGPRPPISKENTNRPAMPVRTRRLMKEFQELQRIQAAPNCQLPFSVELATGDSLYEWHVRLNRVDPDSLLAADMKSLSIDHILLHVTFPECYPFKPPFMRVVSPTIEKGYVMEGGAICMELLTPRGWASAYMMESVIMQFAASLVKGQARISRKRKTRKQFSQREAEESFRVLVKTHEKYGWVTPPMSDG